MIYNRLPSWRPLGGAGCDRSPLGAGREQGRRRPVAVAAWENKRFFTSKAINYFFNLYFGAVLSLPAPPVSFPCWAS